MELARTFPDRLGCIRTHSTDPNAYAALQPGLAYFDDAAGFVAFRRSLFRPVVLGDPVASEEDRAGVLDAFLASSRAGVFVNVTEGFGAALHERGYRLAPFGTELVLETSPDRLRRSRAVKGALKQARKAELALEPVEFATADPAFVGELRAVNDEYLAASRSGKEISFISRGVVFDDLPDVRFYALRVRDAERPIVGFIVADPIYEGGRRVGFQLNAIRLRRTKIWGVYLAVVVLLAERLAAEGLGRLSLGGLAFDEVERPSPFSHDPKILRRLAVVRRHSDRFYGMSGFTSMKLEFEGEKLRRYVAIPPRSSVTRSAFRFLIASGVFS